jgi:hypothetical protein
MTGTGQIIQQIDEQINAAARQIAAAAAQEEAARRRLGETWADLLALVPGGVLGAGPEKQVGPGKQKDAESKPAAPTDWLGQLLSESQDGVPDPPPPDGGAAPRPDTRVDDDLWRQILEEERAPFHGTG